jgi:hypothetical protein
LRHRVPHFYLCAHFLDFCVLLLHTRDQRFHSVVEFSDRGFLLLNLAVLFLDPRMFFKKLVEQHGVDLLVSN